MSIKVEKLTLWSNRTNVRAARTPATEPAGAPAPATIRPRRAAIKRKNATVTDASTKGSLKGEALRSAILDAAATLFIERGTGGTSMQDIAEALGLSRTAVYYYFKNKDAILRALTEEVLNTARKLAGDTVARADLDPVQALGALVTQHADLILSRPAEFRVADRTEGDMTPKQRAALQAARRSLLENFSVVIERACATASSAWSIRTSRPSA